MIYVVLDKDDFVEGWSTSEMTNSIPINKEKMIDEIKENFRSYKYLISTDEFIKDETKILKDSKDSKIYEFNNLLTYKNINGFEVLLEGEKLTFRNTDSNRSFLQKSYSMFESGLINSTTMKFIDNENNEVTRVVKGTNIYEIWMLSFIHEDDLNSYFNNNILPAIENAKTLEELNNIRWEDKSNIVK